MAMTVKSSGNTTPGTLDVEETLLDTADLGVYVPNVSLTNLVNGESCRIRCYKKSSSGGSHELVWDTLYAHIQGMPFKQGPMVDSPYGFKLTVTQSGGTLRAYRWFVSRLDG